ncbi:MAG: ureidoglycolate lyase [Pseudomonadota bacterium]
MIPVYLEPLSADAFAPFGDVLHATGAPDKIINQGLCERFHDRARLDAGDGRLGISLFHAQPRTLPLALDMLERHPLGSQAFIPMHRNPFLVVVAKDNGGVPEEIRAFFTAPGQGVNYHANTWHGVLAPLHPPGLFAVIDRIGAGQNLQEHWFEKPVTVHAMKSPTGETD